MKEKEDLKKEIEAVLFAAGRKVTVDEIAKICIAKKEEIEEGVKELKHDYEQKNSPLLLTEEIDGYKLTVREKYLSIVKEVTPHTELNRAMMETLAVIAWKQPVMQAEVIKIRTSKAYEDIKYLVEMGFISKEKHGRSYILKPTGKFFEYFDLPGKEAVKEIFKGVKDVEPETQKKLEAGGEEKIGKFEVYEAAEEKEEEEEKEIEPKEKLGKLEVYTEPEEKEVEEEGGEAEEEGEERGEVETSEEGEETEAEEVEGEGGKEEAEDEKARDLIHKLAREEPEEREEGTEEEEKPEEDEEENETEDEEENEEREETTKIKKEKKKRLPKELEDFAGEDGEESEQNKEKEE